MQELTRKDALAILAKLGIDEEVAIRIKAKWCQVSWRMSPQDLFDLLQEVNCQSEIEQERLKLQLSNKLKAMIGEL